MKGRLFLAALALAAFGLTAVSSPAAAHEGEGLCGGSAAVEAAETSGVFDCFILEGNGFVQLPAKLCSQCSFGSKINNCVVCGRWVGNASIPARICSQCGFGSKANNCVSCGRWVGNHTAYGKLCSQCGFGSKKDNCVLCGRRVN